MYKTPKPTAWLTITFLLLVFNLASQDIHFSQFANSPLNLNPALTGAFDGDYRFKSSFRNQWNPLIPYQTFTLSGEKNFCTVKCDASNCWRPEGWSLGALFNYDVAGDANLSLTQLEFSASYNKYVGSGISLAGGLMLGGGQRSFSRKGIRLENPNDPSNPSKDREARFLFDVSTGLNLHYQSCKGRTNFDIGSGIYHLNQPKTNFFDVLDINLPTRFSIYGVAAIQLIDDLDLLINTQAQFQGPYQEIVLGAGGRILAFAGGDPGGFIFDINLGYRLDDALILGTEFHLNMWRLGISYDFTTSSVSNLNNGRGGIEFALGYIIANPNPARVCKVQF
ncbi:MAG: PorP/SprF family type IX secretion system membrane protein [Saprospiraceae bacterium]